MVLYGQHPACVRGKAVKKKTSRAIADDNLVLDEKRQTLYSDVMHMDGEKFLVTVCELLQLTIQYHIERETQNVLGVTLQGQLELLCSCGFVPTTVHTDPQSAFCALVGQFPGVVIGIGGAGDYVSKVDAKIRRIKELYRSVKASLPWKLPKALVKDLVAYAVAWINIQRTSAINQNVCPKVLFTGLKINYKKELELGFGDYCEVCNGMDNISKSHMILCIALCPSNNAMGLWEFLSLTANKRIRHMQWQKMVTSEVIINMMNSYDPSGDVEDDVSKQQEAEQHVDGVVPPLPGSTSANTSTWYRDSRKHGGGPSTRHYRYYGDGYG
jgi:hypothetical protein